MAVACATAAGAPPILFATDAPGVVVSQDQRLSMPADAPLTWFTDRPARRTGTARLSALVRNWDIWGFRADPPNAAVLLRSTSGRRTHVVTLTSPRLRDGRVTFRMRPVPEFGEAGYAHEHDLQPGRYPRGQLFIDDAAYPPCDILMTAPITCTLYADPTNSVRATPGTRQVTIRACAAPYAQVTSVSVQAFYGAPAQTTALPVCPTWSAPIAVAPPSPGNWWSVDVSTLPPVRNAFAWMMQATAQ
jgi:hypothetical protein